MNTLGEALSGENPEEALDQFHPGGMGRDVVEVDPRMTLKPLLSRFVFVNIEVVQNNMELTVGKANRYLVHETQEVDRGSPLLNVGQDSAAGNFQGGQQ